MVIVMVARTGHPWLGLVAVVVTKLVAGQIPGADGTGVPLLVKPVVIYVAWHVLFSAFANQ